MERSHMRQARRGGAGRGGTGHERRLFPPPRQHLIGRRAVMEERRVRRPLLPTDSDTYKARREAATECPE